MLPTFEHHHEQGWSNSCVSACVCIICKWRGQTYDESTLRPASGSKGIPLSMALPYVGGKRICPDPEELLASAPLWFAAGKVLIAKVSGPVYVKLMGLAPGGYPSQHGALAAQGDHGAPFHALVLIGLGREFSRTGPLLSGCRATAAGVL